MSVLFATVASNSRTPESRNVSVVTRINGELVSRGNYTFHTLTTDLDAASKAIAIASQNADSVLAVNGNVREFDGSKGQYWQGISR